MLTEVRTSNRCYFVDENGYIQGEYREWHGNGQLRIQGYYIDGEQNGLHRRWYVNGNIWKQYTYVNGSKQGEHKTWHENGQLSNCCYYVNGQKHGEYKSWYYYGQISINCFYVNGEYIPFTKLPYPQTEEDRMYFKLKYDLNLLPVETLC